MGLVKTLLLKTFENSYRTQCMVIKELAILGCSVDTQATLKIVATGFALGAYIPHYTMASHLGFFEAM
ncbi:hypothetical protein F5Y12DRAFT_745509, partial [Xylaria sp. FL1777]